MTTVNIMNFVRATEPRLEMDLFGCLEKQLACMEKYGLKSTLLLQYDALINEEYRNLIKQYEDILDIGLWLEIVRPLCNKAGVKYNGRLDWGWDHHSNATFAIGYDIEDRYKLIDVAMEDFKTYFGKYPNWRTAKPLIPNFLNMLSSFYRIPFLPAHNVGSRPIPPPVLPGNSKNP